MSNFVYEEKDKKLLSLRHAEDPYKMNWVEGKTLWGTVKHPSTIEVERHLSEMDETLTETYIFQNSSDFPVFLNDHELSIYVPFNDDYVSSRECLTRRCHTHIYCGGNSMWIMALRMGGAAPHLGLVLTEGSIESYSIERDLKDRSNDRGDFIVHPTVEELEPGESYTVSWSLFWFTGEADFFRRILANRNIPVIQPERCTYLVGEEIHYQTWMNGQLVNTETVPADNPGEKIFTQEIEGKKACFKAYVSEAPDLLTESRVRFITEKQQFHRPGSSLDGAYLIYDNETGHLFYSHLDDQNGGRERIGMGVLVACWLQENRNEKVYESLKEYETYFYRELFMSDTGIVCNDIKKNNDWNRLYNYPWAAVFLLEMYRLEQNTKYLLDAFHVMKSYYAQNGDAFYAIALPNAELYESLLQQGYQEDASELREYSCAHAENIMKNGTDYPESEVQYEQSIVAPAVQILMNAYRITGEEKYLDAAEEQLRILGLFNGHQPDYHQYENAIRHWDGYWFGKRRRYGDCYPHYWSALTGLAFLSVGEARNDAGYMKRGSDSLRGCLNLFRSDGSASCAMVFPYTVSGAEGYYYDPWANDQDWALYFAYRNRENI
jgi:hypothetical protein